MSEKKDIDSNNEQLENRKKIKKDIQTRLRRIEGQVKGIERMLDNEACCRDVLVQIAAVRAAVNKAGALIFQNYAKDCVNCKSDLINEEKIDELISTLVMFMK